jgi:hypothetical protein
MDVDEVRAFARTLPGTTEEPHFELRSFRLGTKIYATFTPTELRVFVDAAGVAAAVARSPAVEALYWGEKLAGARIRLEGADPEHVRALLVEAWARKAPRRIVAVYPAR